MDPRDEEAANGKWYTSLDKNRMTATVDVYDEDGNEHEVELPFKFDVCGLCEGKGTHVNPSIDAHGISSDEFYEDPDFGEEYFSGRYDVSCYRCGGANVEPELDTEHFSEQQKKWHEMLLEYQEGVAEFAAEREAERRMGC